MILFSYTDYEGILSGDGESRYELWGSSFVFSSWYVISIDTGHIAQSPQSGPRWSPAFMIEPILFSPSRWYVLLYCLDKSPDKQCQAGKSEEYIPPPPLYSEQFLLSVFKSPIQVSESTLFSNFNHSQQDIYEKYVILSSLCNGRIPAKKCRENGKIIGITIFIILN